MLVLRKLEIDEDPAVPLLGIYMNDIPSYHMGTCSAMFTVALFIIGQNWKQPRYLSTEG